MTALKAATSLRCHCDNSICQLSFKDMIIDSSSGASTISFFHYPRTHESRPVDGNVLWGRCCVISVSIFCWLELCL
jgi:hypothetical protein